jgi:hypothetical protein
MAKSNRKSLAKSKYAYLEKWDTRFGQSERVVIRDGFGHFVDNVSLTALRKSKVAPNSRKR